MRASATLAGALAALALVACGDDDSGGDGSSDAAQTEQITVGVLPISALAPVHLGIDKGFFEREGLDVKLQESDGGAALLPSVVSGEIDFAYSNNVSLLIAAAEGLPIEIVTNGADESEDKRAINSSLVAAKGSAIRTPTDLEGGTVAVNTLKNVGDVTIKAALEKKGVDVSTLQFVEIPFPEMLPALEAKRVDAVWLVSPFTLQAKQAGHRTLAYPFYDTKPGLTIASYFTSSKLAQEDPKLVERFVRAMNRSLEYTSDHTDEFRRITPEFTEIPSEVVKLMPPNLHTTEIDRDELALTADLMTKYGLIDEAPELDELIWQP